MGGHGMMAVATTTGNKTTRVFVGRQTEKHTADVSRPQLVSASAVW